MSDDVKIYELYVENAAANEQPKMRMNKNGSKEWRLHGRLHHDDAPAVEWNNGDKFWYHHGALHREDAPAIDKADGDKFWYYHGVLHREDGAAIDKANGTKMWFLHGKEYENVAAWAQAVLKRHNKPHDADAVQKYMRTILTKDDLI